MSDDQISVRRIEEAEFDVLRRIRLEALLDEPSAFGMTHEEEVAYPQQKWIHAARDRSSGPEQANFFAREGDSVVGLVGAYRDRPGSDVLHLVSMWVRATQRGSPAATALVDAVVTWGTEAGYEACELWVTQGNDRALRFYERCGFAPTGEFAPLPSDPCKDELRMRLPLGPT